ncbi:MAG: response regulator [Candidatus Aureabacteria bacterium]|nr:response regulator [Candidatus Auribacterota bacterium]MCK5160115.1 response regulator [Candidatus Auribacterota bacterium]
MPKKVLIIDDEPNILATLRDRLVYEGYDVITAIDGSSGIKQAYQNKPDLIVLDIMLPDMDGHQVCRILKSTKNIKIPIIVVTSKVDAVDALKVKKSGADDFTVKTMDYKSLIEAIKRLI